MQSYWRWWCKRVEVEASWCHDRGHQCCCSVEGFGELILRADWDVGLVSCVGNDGVKHVFIPFFYQILVGSWLTWCNNGIRKSGMHLARQCNANIITITNQHNFTETTCHFPNNLNSWHVNNTRFLLHLI